ncbi:MAG: prepilin-type N-terminal cleavage/methylation domain-containing protein [Verrucomicrobiota bacterium]|nr:prepilin-type N-terminal cleavage/methylation domain-containing protein [Verrucomicrobiota bacterium]
MHSQNRPLTIPRAGFTLLELIGVMAVIAILAAAVLPSAIDLIRTQRAVKEGAELPEIAEALKRGMLREQIFPIYENDADELTEGNEAYWWNLAARHGGGSANEVRYPLGIRPRSSTTRKLYFAEASWGIDTFDGLIGNGTSFNYITGDGPAKSSENAVDGWVYPNDPTELRLLLISTTNPDLPLPDTLNEQRFNKFWEYWVGDIDGNPASGTWSDYGFSSTEWDGRAAELNVQRIDLRDWLCTVVIENRRAIEEASGDEFDDDSDQKTGTLLDDEWDLGTVYAYTTNQAGSEIILQLKEVSDNSDPTAIYSYTEVKNVVLTKRGRVIEEASPITIEVSGRKTVQIGSPPVSTSSTVNASIELNLTNLAPIALIGPNNVNINLFDFENDSATIENRYFLLNQELLLKEPWNQNDVGIFSITENFSTLRFDGLGWHY